MSEHDVLTLNGREGSDYTLRQDHSCWIEHNGVAIYIVPGETGVTVQMYQSGMEMDDPLQHAYVDYSDLKDEVA